MVRHDSTARSRAVVHWPSAGQPEEFLNTVPVMPSSRALAVMRSAKLSSLPDIPSAMHHAGVVARQHDHALDQVLDRDLAAELDEHARAAHVARPLADAKARVELQAAGRDLLEGDVDRHHLRHRRGMHRLVGILEQQHRRGLRIDHEGLLGERADADLRGRQRLGLGGGRWRRGLGRRGRRARLGRRLLLLLVLPLAAAARSAGRRCRAARRPGWPRRQARSGDAGDHSDTTRASP